MRLTEDEDLQVHRPRLATKIDYTAFQTRNSWTNNIRQPLSRASTGVGTLVYSPVMKQVLLVALGGGLGAVARYKLGGFILHRSSDWLFPLGTFLVNVLGCLIAGVLAGLVERQEWFSTDGRLFLFTGVLGGFTTFSAFGLETVYLLRRGETAIALLYAVTSVLFGLATFWIGLSVIPHRQKLS